LAGGMIVRHEEPSYRWAVGWSVVWGVFLILLFGVHLDLLVQTGMKRTMWNITGPDTLTEGLWHDLLFSRIVLWASIFAFGLFVLAAADAILLSGALLVVASFGMPVTIAWVASMLKFDSTHVKQI